MALNHLHSNLHIAEAYGYKPLMGQFNLQHAFDFMEKHLYAATPDSNAEE